MRTWRKKKKFIQKNEESYWKTKLQAQDLACKDVEGQWVQSSKLKLSFCMNKMWAKEKKKEKTKKTILGKILYQKKKVANMLLHI
jgi:hypothetical protein